MRRWHRSSTLFPYTTLFRSPVMERSGKSEWVHLRRACPKFLRQTFHEWAGHSIAFCEWARVYRSEEHTSELQSHSELVCRLLLEKKKTVLAAAGVAEERLDP